MNWLVKTFYLVLFEIFFALATLVKSGRATHTRGVVALGTFRVVDAPTFPANGFFTPGRELSVVGRHANVSYADGAALDIRGCALGFSERGGSQERVLDLVMNSGPVTFSTAKVFWRFARASAPRRGKEESVNQQGLREFLEADSEARTQFELSVRRAPESYTGVRYASKLVFRFTTVEREYYVRFRLLNVGGGPEQGMPSARDLDAPWEQDRLPGQTQAWNYLELEFATRVEAGQAKRMLQMQLREADSALPQSVFDPGREWSEHDCPWHDVGWVDMTEVAGDDVVSKLKFDVGRLPPSTMALFKCKRIDDYHSIGFIRSRIYPAEQRLRFWLERRAQADEKTDLDDQIEHYGKPLAAAPTSREARPKGPVSLALRHIFKVARGRGGPKAHH
ncbi:MAG: catalase [Myxococcota bacterium]